MPSGGLKVGSNLPISQLGVVKCLARGRQGERSTVPEIVVKHCILDIVYLCDRTFILLSDSNRFSTFSSFAHFSCEFFSQQFVKT